MRLQRTLPITVAAPVFVMATTLLAPDVLGQGYCCSVSGNGTSHCITRTRDKNGRLHTVEVFMNGRTGECWVRGADGIKRYESYGKYGPSVAKKKPIGRQAIVNPLTDQKDWLINPHVHAQPLIVADEPVVSFRQQQQSRKRRVRTESVVDNPFVPG